MGLRVLTRTRRMRTSSARGCRVTSTFACCVFYVSCCCMHVACVLHARCMQVASGTRCEIRLPRDLDRSFWDGSAEAGALCLAASCLRASALKGFCASALNACGRRAGGRAGGREVGQHGRARCLSSSIGTRTGDPQSWLQRRRIGQTATCRRSTGSASLRSTRPAGAGRCADATSRATSQKRMQQCNMACSTGTLPAGAGRCLGRRPSPTIERIRSARSG